MAQPPRFSLAFDVLTSMMLLAAPKYSTEDAGLFGWIRDLDEELTVILTHKGELSEKVWKSALYLPINQSCQARNELCVMDPRTAYRTKFLSREGLDKQHPKVDLVKVSLLDSSAHRLWLKSTYMVSGAVWFTLVK